ncbi:MAG: DegV family protein [Dehalococcoidia bacterium]|nr:DegV family protein [Dehalococcoidia bacterium]MDD5494947.1 DegV family protein [Dehalococcoidia bacterium]
MDGKVAIVTDSLGCIPEEELKKYNICEVPVKIVFGNKVYQDRVDLSADEFYAMLREAKQLPTTSAPSPEHFLNAYREMSREATRILCITLSSKLSGTFNSARVAADMAREALSHVVVEVLDSQVAAAAEGFVVLAAARAAAAGMKMDEVVKAARQVINSVNLYVVVDTLKYLIKGGRVPRVVGWAGSLLNIKPILMLRNGEAHPVARARTYLSAVKQIMELSKNKIIKGLPLHMAVIHAAEPEKAAQLKEQVAASFDCAELIVTDFTPVIGAHTGPGVVGLAFYCGE